MSREESEEGEGEWEGRREVSREESEEGARGREKRRGGRG